MGEGKQDLDAVGGEHEWHLHLGKEFQTSTELSIAVTFVSKANHSWALFMSLVPPRLGHVIKIPLC